MLQARNGSVVRTNVVAVESSLLPVSGTFPRFLAKIEPEETTSLTSRGEGIHEIVHTKDRGVAM